jgi:hypothetical protein
VWSEIVDQRCFADIDTPADLARLTVRSGVAAFDARAGDR